MSKVRILSGNEIKTLFTIPMALSAVESCYMQKSSGSASVWPMVFHEFDPGHADLDIKSGDLGAEGIYGLKVVSWYETNPARKLPALFGTSLIFDLATGAPKALLNAGPITDLRTGAAAAIGAKYLARPESENLLVVGCGVLAPFMIAAGLMAMPGLKKVTVINPHHPEKAVEKLPAIREEVEALFDAAGKVCTASVEVGTDGEAAAREANIIFTATPAREAVIPAGWVKPGTHLSCIGSDMSGKQELDMTLFASARVFGDDTAQCLSVGECEKAYKAGLLPGLAGEIGDVIAGNTAGRTDPEQITIFDSTGIALQDLSSAAAVLAAAEAKGIGLTAEL